MPARKEKKKKRKNSIRAKAYVNEKLPTSEKKGTRIKRKSGPLKLIF